MAEKTQSQKFTVIPLELLNALTEYLTKQPFRDVVGYINAIQSTTRIVDSSELKNVKFEEPEREGVNENKS